MRSTLLLILGIGFSLSTPALPAPAHAGVLVLALQDETPEQKRQREEIQRQQEEAQKKFQEDWEKLKKDMPKEVGEAAAWGCFGCAVAIITGLAALGVWIFMFIFTAKDAKARNDQNMALWLVLIFFLHWVGFLVYILARPKGDLGPCPKCNQKMMITLPKCPHCGNETAAAAPPPKPPEATPT